ncbi:hypothetical protein LRP49_02285 [Enterovibrio sp. ZSDZ35]|uniref:Teneurin-like YD-shell domain-containing protein n=1 Tax=Enterovibrio qingdaonensis TaxID=2899818 RepID=A0ABT5QI63_9GAMM|nr:RHS repeat-associated core domain-containing protein [Enterovibrio sp. ZSDZ35]MDD1780016.1 hypothetical protein [Enterovibrio sp. ZSDZ35]
MRRILPFLLAVFVNSAGATEVGSLPGELTVQSGTVNYDIPISLPSGRGGNTPTLSLTYNSQDSARGVIGSGFSLSGLSSISRCGSTPNIDDGNARSVQFDHRDNFCLEGERLVLFSGQNGQDGAVYRPYIDNYSKVELRGSASSESSSFKVFTKGGDILTYGQRWHNQSWLLTEVNDRTGQNPITYNYSSSGQIESIQYDIFNVIFHYSNARQALNTRSQRIHNVTRNDKLLLWRIDVHANNRLKNYYKLTRKDLSNAYDTTAKVQQITSIEYCDASNECLPKTSFEWLNEKPEKVAFKKNIPHWGKLNGNQGTDWFLDLTGNKKLDYCRLTSTQVIQCQFDVAKSNSKTVNFSLPAPIRSDLWWSWIDMDGDGRTDLCQQAMQNYFYCTEFYDDGHKSDTDFWTAHATKGHQWIWSTDFNGDARPDICYRTTGDRLACQTSYDGNTFQGKHHISGIQWGPDTHTWWTDIDGNGYDDLCTSTNQNTNGTLSCTRFNDAEIIVKNQKITIDEWGKNGERWWIDVNADGADDFCRVFSDRKMKCSFGSIGNIQTLNVDVVLDPDPLIQMPMIYPPPVIPDPSYFWLDNDRDGLLEFCRTIGRNRTTLRCTNIGNKNYDFSLGEVGKHAGRRWFLDINEDGITEYCRHTGTDSGTGSFFSCNDMTLAKHSPSLLSSVTNGLGYTSRVEYAPHKEVGHTNWPTPTSYPYVKQDPNNLVVSKSFNDDGVGGENITEFYYGPSRYHLLGFGSSGYSWIKQREYNQASDIVRGREVTYLTDGLLSGYIAGAKEFYIDGTQSGSQKWNFSDAVLLNRSDKEYGMRDIGRYKTITQVDIEGTSSILNGQEGYLDTFTFEDETYYKVNNVTLYIPLANGQMTPLIIPSSQYFRLAETEHTKTSSASLYTEFHFTAKLVPLSQEEVERVVPNLEPTNQRVSIEEINGGNSFVLSSDAKYGHSRNVLFAIKETEKSYNLSGQLLTTVETLQDESKIDEFGNVGEIEVRTTGVNPVTRLTETFSEKTASIYQNDAARWILGRLTESSVTHTNPNGQSETRSSRFEYNEDTGFLAKQISEPQHALSTTQTYVRNNEGQVTKSTLSAWSGTGVSNRASTTFRRHTLSWLTVATTNAKDQRTSKSVDRYYSNKTIVKDVNGLDSKTLVDSFNRVVETLIKSEDGYNSVLTAFHPISSSQCPHSVEFAIYCHVTDTEGSGKKIVYFDTLEREVASATLSLNNRWVMSNTRYNTSGQVAKVSRPYFSGDAVLYAHTQYDALGRIKTVSEPGPAGKPPTWRSFEYGSYAYTEIDALNRKTTTYSNAKGQEIRVVQPTGSIISKSYSPTGKLILAVGADGKTIRNQYDVMGNKTHMNDPDLGQWHYSYNGFGELVSQTDAKGQKTRFSYDVLGRMLTRTEETISGSGAEKSSSAETTKWFYDSYGDRSWKGAVLRVEKPNLIKNLYYTSLGQLAKEEAITEQHTFSRSLTYNQYGMVVTDKRPNDFSLNYEYDSATGVNTGVWGDKAQFQLQFSESEYQAVIKPLIDEALAKARDYVDKATALTQETALLKARADEYYALKDQIEHVSGDTPEIESAVSGKPLSVFIGPNGEKYLKVPHTFVLTANNMATPLMLPPPFHLKLTGNELSKVSIDEWASVESQLTASEATVFYGDFDESGLAGITEITVGRDHPFYDKVITDSFERLSNLAAEIQRLEYLQDHLHQEANSYLQAAKQLISLTEQTQFVAARYKELGDDSVNELENLANLDASTSEEGKVYYWKLNSLDASGRIRSELYGNGLVNLYDYNAGTGQLQNISTQNGQESLRILHYVYDRMDNVLQRTDYINSIEDIYGYDALDRVTSNILLGLGGKHVANPLFNQRNTISYNKAGNITNKSDVGDYHYADTRHAHAVTQAGNRSYTYDANGNMLTGDNRIFTWNGVNKPIKVSKGSEWVSFLYDENNQRHYKANSKGDQTWYVGKMYERTQKANGDTVHKQFIKAGGKLVAVNIDLKKTNADGTSASVDRQIRYTHSDALGSNDLVTDMWGNIVARYSYDTWGKKRSFVWETSPTHIAQNPLLNRGYTGHEEIDEVGLIHMNGRLYDATLARFVSADVYIQASSNSQSFNRYSYVLNNPLKYTDPSGHFFKAIKKAFKKVVNSVKRVIKGIGKAIKKIGKAYVKLVKKVAKFVKENAFEIVVMAISVVQPWVGLAIRAARAAATGGIRGLVTTLATSALFFGVGEAFQVGGFGTARWAMKTVAHGVAGGMSSVMRGGKFGDGFMSAAVTQAFSPYIDGIDRGTQFSGARITIAAVIGGTTAELTGGKFSDGAAMGALARMFNDEQKHAINEEKYSNNSQMTKYKGTWQHRDNAALVAAGLNPNTATGCSALQVVSCALIGTIGGAGGTEVTEALDTFYEAGGKLAELKDINVPKQLDWGAKFLTFGPRFDVNQRYCRATCNQQSFQRQMD